MAKESYELLPPEGDKKVGEKVFQIVGEVIQHKIGLGLHEKWIRHYEYAKNRYWKNENAVVPLRSANLLHTHRMRTVNTLTDREPTFNLAKVGELSETDEQNLEKVQRACEHWWRETEQQDILDTSVNLGEMNGCAVEKVMFDPDAEYGIGEIVTLPVDPFHFGFYPVQAKDHQRAEANLHFYPLSVREAKKRWPKYADQIKPDTEVLKDLGEERLEVTRNRDQGFLRRLYSEVQAIFGMDEKDQENRLLVVECWVRDGSAVTVKEGKNEITRPKYPGEIRRVTACNGGKLVLEDIPNPNINPTLDPEQAQLCYLYDKFPFNMVPSIKDPVSAWGMSDWEQLSDLARAFNKALSQNEYFKDKAVRPKVINPKNSGVDNGQFNNATGVINPSDHLVAQGIGLLETSNLGLAREIKESINLYRELFFLVAGTFEMEQAQTGQQVTAYKAIAALLEHAATMMRGKIRNYQRLIRNRGRMYVSLAANFYTEDRFISYEDDGQTEVEKINYKSLLVPAKLTVVSGSTMPRSEVAEREEAMELFKAGAVDQIALLEKFNWPKRSEVIQRMQAGPMGEALRRMMELGLDEERLAFLQQVLTMEQKDFDKAVEKGEIPPLQLPEPGADPMQALEQETKRAEIELTKERANSERTKQHRDQAAIQLDSQMMSLRRAETQLKLQQIEQAKAGKGKLDLPDGDGTTFLDNRPGYNEQGMETNNVSS